MFGELLSLMLGQSAAEALRDTKRSRASSPEGETNALMGIVSAGLGSFGLLLGLLVARIGPLTGPISSTSLSGVAIIAAIGLGCSCFGFHFGRRALRVTRRHIAVAKCGAVISSVGMAISVASLAVMATRNFL